MDQEMSQLPPAHCERILDKTEIHRILEGMFLHQVMDLLSPCFKVRQSHDSDGHFDKCSSQMADLSSPSESLPKILEPTSQFNLKSALDFIKLEISQRTGATVW
jgi:hypothetical protein